MRSAQQPVRIAYVINDLLYGGAQQMVLAVAMRLTRDQFEPTVYYLNEYGPERPSLKEEFKLAHIRTVYIGTGQKTSIARAVLALYAAFRTERPSLVHTHLVDASLSGIIAARLAFVRAVFVHEHQTHWQYSWRIRTAYHLLRALATLTICYSGSVERELFRAVHLLTEPTIKRVGRSCTIQNGIDSKALTLLRKNTDRSEVRRILGIPENTLIIMSVARLVPWKGHRQLMGAFTRIAVTFPNAHLCIVGEGALESELQGAAKKAGLSERVHLLGVRADSHALLAGSDIASLAYFYDNVDGEAIGLSGLEALALGIPLIASDYSSALDTVIPEETAILVMPGSTDTLENALSRLLSDPELRARIGGKAAAFIHETRDWNTLVRIYERLYTLFI